MVQVTWEPGQEEKKNIVVAEKSQSCRLNAWRRKNALILKIMRTLFYLMMAGLRLHSAIT